MKLQLTHLHPEFDRLQEKHGAGGLCGIYGAGCTENPRVCFVFMNPTGKNVSSAKSWKGLKAPWIGTKNTWKLFNAVGVISDATLADILLRKPENWNYDVAESVYRELAGNGVYVTNLGKCTQCDAAHVGDAVFREYLPLLEREIAEIKPGLVIAFGNQVSSILLGMPVKVSEMRKKIMTRNGVKFMPVYYPVGQGMRNIALAIEDIKLGLNESNKRSAK